jgi:hypothetical protein
MKFQGVVMKQAFALKCNIAHKYEFNIYLFIFNWKLKFQIALTKYFWIQIKTLINM